MSQSQQNDPLIGVQMGDYRIEGVLGTGGMARVYRGYDEKLERYAAIKVIEPRLIASDEEEEYRERFLREARAIARLSHAQIVGVYQFGQYDNLYYIAMEYIEGRNLREVIKGYQKQSLPMPNEEAVRILRDVAEALDSAHRHNIIHRDVKPSNIIVNPDGHGILTDFGLALNSLEGTIGNTFGSVHYIAPEQAISSAQAVPQSDQYSLAIIAYELFSGRVPFDDASAMSVALKHISDLPPPLHDTLPDFPLDAEVVILKALDKDSTRRYGSCAEFIAALSEALRMNDGHKFATMSRQRASLPRPMPSMDEEWPTYQPMPDGKTQSLGGISSITDVLAKARRRRLAWLVAGIGLAFVVGALVLLTTLTPPINEGATGTAVVRESIGTATQEARIAAAIELTSAARATQTTAAQQTSVFVSETAEARIAAAIESTSNVRATRTASAQETASAIAQETGFVTATAQARQDRTATADARIATQNADSTATENARATATPSATITPSPIQATSTPTPTDLPTDTNTPTATNTPAPTATNTPTPTPGLAMADEFDSPVVLNYDGRALVLYNRSTGSLRDDDLRDLQFWLFEPDEEGLIQQTAIYRGQDWAMAPLLSTNNCLLVYINRLNSFESEESPANICRTVTAFRATRAIFWLSLSWDKGAYFEVRRGPVDVIATCAVSEPETRRIKRCLVPMS